MAKQKVARPAGLSKQDKADLTRILKKARAFKAYYGANPSVKKKR